MLFVSLFLCFIVALYFYVKKCHNYWKEQGVITVPTNFFFSISFDFLMGHRSLEAIYEDLYKDHPNEPYVGLYKALKPVLFIRDPELIYHITVKNFNHFHDRQAPLSGGGRLIYGVPFLSGEEWRTSRKKIIPSFSPNKLKKMYGMIEDCVEMVIEQYFRPSTANGEPVDVKEAMARFSLDVIGKCAFGLEFNTVNDSNSFYREVGMAFSDSGFKNTLRLALQNINPNLLKYFRMKLTSDNVEKFFIDLLQGAEEVRRRKSYHEENFMQLMLHLKDENNNESNHLFTEDRIASNMFIFYFAGHETTAITATFALHELAKNPEIQEKLRGEIRTAKDANNGVLDYNTLKNITYLEMVISETLRLHEPITFISRICTENYQIPGSSIKMKAGDRIIFSVSALHKDEKYFPEPTKFNPERFSPENKSQINRHAYMPFGSGPRMCLGPQFAELELKICLAAIVSRFKISVCEKTEAQVVLSKSGLFHAPKNNVWLVVEEI